MATYGTIEEKKGPEPNLAVEPPSHGDQARSNFLSQGQEVLSDAEELAKQLVKFTKYVVPIFIVIAVFSLVSIIVGAIGVVDKFILIWEILLLNLVGAFFGAWGIYKWGTVEDEIDIMRGENNKYEAEVLQLQTAKQKLSKEVDSMQTEVQELQTSVDELEKQLAGFDELRASLEEIAGENEEINDVLNKTTRIFTDMRSTAMRNERAALLNLYYDVAFRDSSEGMNKGEYRRFLGRLPKKQRAQFEGMGSFEKLAGSDGILDLKEFQDLLERFLGQIEKELLSAGFDDN